MMVPSQSSQSLNKAYKMDDFPAPVRPTIPTFMPGYTVKERFLMLGSRHSRYLMEAF